MPGLSTHACAVKPTTFANGLQPGRLNMRHVHPRCAAVHGDLLIVGPGVLGSLVGKLWKDRNPDAAVLGQTNTSNNHQRLSKLGFDLRTTDEVDETMFPNVVFAAPPSGSDDYAAEVSSGDSTEITCDSKTRAVTVKMVDKAAQLWDGSGALLFTSSIGVYDVPEGTCREDSPVYSMDHSDRIKKIRLAEDSILEAGGSVIRFVGLYHGQRGAHTFFLKKGTVERYGGSIINLIHYEDAASMVIAVLEGSSAGPFRKEVFIGGDDHPLTFQDMMDAFIEYGPSEDDVEFIGAPSSPGKTVDSKASKEKLQWAPKYTSFVQFMQATRGQDWYAVQD